MRRRAGSWFFLSISIGSLLLIPACATDRSEEFAAVEIPIVLTPGPSNESDGSPAVSEGARVLAWVRTLRSPDHRQLIRWDRAEDPEMLFEQSGAIRAIDLSGDGGRIAALVGEDSLWIWDAREPGQARYETAPAGYSQIASPRWIDEERILVGGVGPEGYGLWTWDLGAKRLDPVCTRFADDSGELWLGISGGLDRSGTYFCMERSADGRVSGFVGRREDCSVVRALEGDAPAFWQIDDTEEDGLLYLDRSHNMIGERPATGERFVLLGSAFGFDVTADGRWVFAQVSRPAGRRLLLLHLLEPR